MLRPIRGNGALSLIMRVLCCGNGVCGRPDSRALSLITRSRSAAPSGEHRRALAGNTGSVLGVAFSPDGRLLAGHRLR